MRGAPLTPIGRWLARSGISSGRRSRRKGFLRPPNGSTRSFTRSSGEFADVEEYIAYLRGAILAEPDPAVAARIRKILSQAEAGTGPAVVFKRAKVDREFVAYLTAMAERHGNPEVRAAAERVLEHEGRG